MVTKYIRPAPDLPSIFNGDSYVTPQSSSEPGTYIKIHTFITVKNLKVQPIMAAVNFKELMKLNRSTVERPKSAPKCWLVASIGAMTHETVGANQTDKLTFELLNPEPHPDTEEGLLEGVDLKKLRSPFSKTLAATYWITPDAVHFLSDMLDRVVGEDDRDIEEKLPDLRGARVMFMVTPHIVDNVDSGQNNVDGRTMTAAE